MARSTQLRLDSITGSLPALKPSQIAQGADAASFAAADIQDILKGYAQAISNIHGSTEFTSQIPGKFSQNVWVTGLLTGSDDVVLDKSGTQLIQKVNGDLKVDMQGSGRAFRAATNNVERFSVSDSVVSASVRMVANDLRSEALAGGAGALVVQNAAKDLRSNANLSWDGSKLAVVGNVSGSGAFSGASAAFDGTLSAGGMATVGGLKDSALTDTRVVFAGPAGELKDASGLVWDGSDLIAASAKVSDLTSGRVVYAGAAGALVDSSEMTFGAGGLTLAKDISARSGSYSGDVTISGNLNVMGATTTVDTQNLLVKDAKIVISSGGIVDGAGLYLADDSAGENIRWATADGGKWIASDKFAADTLQALDLSSAIVWADADGNLVEISPADFASYLSPGFGISSVTTGTIVATEYTPGTGMHKVGFQFSIGQAVETNSQVTFAGVTAYLTGSGLTDGKLLKNANGLVVDASITDYIAEGTGIHKSLTGDVLTLSIGQAVETSSAVTFANITDSGLSASRLMASDASKKLVSVDIKDWIAGTANQVVVSDDLDGSVTLSLPYDISDASNTALVGFTATSILGALNELAAGSAGGKGKWVYTHSGAAAASHTFASGEFLGAGSAAAPVLSAYADVYLNGQLLVNGADYNYSGAAVTLTFNMQADDVLVVIIR